MTGKTPVTDEQGKPNDCGVATFHRRSSNSIQKRLGEHNSGCNKWAKENKPFKNVYYEQYDNLKEALMREKFLKSGKGREF